MRDGMIVMQQHNYNTTICHFFYFVKISGDIDDKSSDLEEMSLKPDTDTAPIRPMSEQRSIKVFTFVNVLYGILIYV